MNTPTYALDRASYNQGRNAQFDMGISDEDRAQKLVAKGPGAVAVPDRHRYTIRRLTPTECARLQGFPDWWAAIPTIKDMDDDTVAFWQEVRSTYAAINGKTYKPATKKQMISWYNKLHTDSAEYKMWGNGVALPVVRIPIHGMAGLGAKTLGRLFDGSGGFPLAGLLDGIETLWASEIEPYPIAVTKWNFSGKAQMLLGGHTNE
jgi:site-specific DNA-cytosine methylase